MGDLNIFGTDLFGEAIKSSDHGILRDKFLIPPFTVLDAKQGTWQERKRAWITLGIKGEMGRDSAVIHCPKQSNKEGLEDANYTSIFDPVLTELSYRWWCPLNGQIIDPFAGGSVRGVVASKLNLNYWGCDLRQEQIDANQVQADSIGLDPYPIWISGDSMKTLHNAPKADFIFTCPPYGDLEKYSDDPDDLSGMEWSDFTIAYKEIILRSLKRLKNDRFACFVVGDFRDKKGYFRNFVSTTIKAFEDEGVHLYNDAILTTMIGSASMRVTKQFNSGRKLVKVHQNLLVFCKGDWKKATLACGDIDVN